MEGDWVWVLKPIEPDLTAAELRTLTIMQKF